MGLSTEDVVHAYALYGLPDYLSTAINHRFTGEGVYSILQLEDWRELAVRIHEHAESDRKRYPRSLAVSGRLAIIKNKGIRFRLTELICIGVDVPTLGLSEGTRNKVKVAHYIDQLIRDVEVKVV